jgi:uncharacterized protein with PIN domain
MAKMLPSLGKIVDVILRIDETKQLILCRDCEAEMIVTSSVTAAAVDDAQLITINQSIMCPSCRGWNLMSLRSKP